MPVEYCEHDCPVSYAECPECALAELRAMLKDSVAVPRELFDRVMDHLDWCGDTSRTARELHAELKQLETGT